MVKKKRNGNSNNTMISRRNPLHNHPLMTKGGVHKKSNKAKRRKETMEIKKAWLPHNIFLRVYCEEGMLKIANV